MDDAHDFIAWQKHKPDATVGGVYVASGDVNGDTDAIGQTVTFTATVSTSASDYSGSHVIYQDVFIPAV